MLKMNLKRKPRYGFMRTVMSEDFIEELVCMYVLGFTSPTEEHMKRSNPCSGFFSRPMVMAVSHSIHLFWP